MAKIKFILFSLCTIFCFTSCDTEGDEIEVGFFSFNYSFVYPSSANDIYKVIFNEEEIQRMGFVPRNNPTGLIEIYNRRDNSLEFSQPITVSPNMTIQFIELNGEVDLYSEEKYTWFVPTLVINTPGEENLYTLTFNGQNMPFSYGERVYINRNNLSGRLELKKEGNTVFSQEYTVTPEGYLNMIEMMNQTTGLMEYTILEGGGDEEEPASDNICKTRFFYTKGYKFADVDSIRAVVSAFDPDQYWMTMDDNLVIPIDTITFKAGELSEYVDLDLTQFRTESSTQPTNFFLDLWDAKPGGAQLSDHTVDMMMPYIETQGYSGDSYFKALYKFQTMRIESADWGMSVYYVFNNGLWETSPTPTE